MAGIKALISLSFGGAIGLMFLMLGCALPQYSKYWPLFVLFFYVLAPIPYCIARRAVDETDATSNACKELAIFLTTGIVVSAFGLPIVLARAAQEMVTFSLGVGREGFVLWKRQKVRMCYTMEGGEAMDQLYNEGHRKQEIEWGACGLVLTGNTVIFATILGFFLVFGSNDDFSWQQW